MLKLYAFGDPYLKGDGDPSLSRLMRQTKRFALLIYLLCDDRERPHRREEITALFWPEADGAGGRNNLRQSLHGIRSLLGAEAIIGNGNDNLRVNQDRIQADVVLFRKRLQEGWPESGLRLYKAPFLSGFFLNDCPGFEAWVEETREELHSTAVAAAMDLAHTSEGQRDLEASLYWWRVAQSHTPYDERILRRIVSLWAGSGNLTRAQAEIRRFKARMHEELGMPVSAETERLADQITGGTFDTEKQWVGDRRARPSVEGTAAQPLPRQRVRRTSDPPEF
jgi:DNA-binding SARP family transcriptional activator